MDPHSLFHPPPFSSLSSGAGNHFPAAGEASAQAPPQNHVASPALPQPPYADMIYAAISALKEPEGSSKRAISKYIEKEYAGMLPEGFAEPLTQQLKRLKNSGLLVMNKKSYMMPTRSEALAAPNPPHFAANGGYAAAPAPVPAAVEFLQGLQQQTGLMFPPGIPPNLFQNPFQQQFAVGLAQAGVQVREQAPAPFSGSEGSVGVKRGRGRPPKPKNEVHHGGNVQAPQQGDGVGAEVNDATQPVFVALGLADDPTSVAKRRPGRPKKVIMDGEGGVVASAPVNGGALPQQQQQLLKRGRGRPPRSGAGLPGRPRKPKSLTAGGIKRGPGRPPKNLNQGTFVNVPFTADPALLNVPRPRGRPRKGIVIPGVGGIMPMKRMGRPPKAFGGINRPMKSTGRPVGRPRKNPLLLNDAHRLGPQSEGYEDMRKKLEFFQSRIMHAVGVLKPEFRNESSHDAIKAIQELEGLASVDITMPFIEDQPPAPAPAPEPAQQS